MAGAGVSDAFGQLAYTHVTFV